MRVRVDAAHPVEYQPSPPAASSMALASDVPPPLGSLPAMPASIFLCGDPIGPLTPSSSESDSTDTCPVPVRSTSPGPLSTASTATPPTPPTDPTEPTDTTNPMSTSPPPQHTPPPPHAHTHALVLPMRMPQVWLTFRLAHADAQRDLTVPMIVHHRVHDYIPLIRHQLGLGLGLRFVYAGVLVRPEDTPLSLGIRGPCVVDVIGAEV